MDQAERRIGHGQLAGERHHSTDKVDGNAPFREGAIHIGLLLCQQSPQVNGQLLLGLDAHGREGGFPYQAAHRNGEVHGVRRVAHEQERGIEAVTQREIREVDFARRGRFRLAAARHVATAVLALTANKSRAAVERQASNQQHHH